MINSDAKGKRGEREAAKFLRGHGFEARRGQQYAGGNDSPDIVHNIPGFHIEVKRTEKLSPYSALLQADGDKSPEDKTLVLHKRNNRPWIVIMYADDFLGSVK